MIGEDVVFVGNRQIFNETQAVIEFAKNLEKIGLVIVRKIC